MSIFAVSAHLLGLTTDIRRIDSEDRLNMNDSIICVCIESKIVSINGFAKIRYIANYRRIGTGNHLVFKCLVI